jgi:cytochrome c
MTHESNSWVFLYHRMTVSHPRTQLKKRKGERFMKKMIGLILIGLMVSGVLGQAIAADKGTAAEAEAMVQKAIDFYKANGKDKTLAEISNPKGQFIQGDLYLFVWDMNGVVIAHGTNPKLIGKDMSQLKDVDGVRFVLSA